MTVYEEIERIDMLDTDDSLARELVRIADLKAQIDILEAEKKMLTERVVKQLDADGHTTVGLTTPQGDALRATVVRSPVKEVNLAELQSINEDLYINITTRKLDSKKLNYALNTGQFSEAELRTVSVVERSPYVRFSPLSGSGGADE